MVLSGQETEADWDEFLDELEEVCKIRKEENANFAMQLSFTPLVIYEQTPLKYEPRTPAHNSFYNIKTAGYFLDKKKKLEEKYNIFIKAKFNGRGSGTFIEQALLDMGHAGTKIIVDMALEYGADYQRFLGDFHKQTLIKSCEEHGIDITDIFRARDPEAIDHSEWNQFVTPKRQENWRQMYKKKSYEMDYCLDTASSKGKCYSCGTCPTGQDIKSIIRRDISSADVEQIIAEMSGSNIVRSATRVVVKKKSQWEIYANQTLVHYVTSQFIRKSPKLTKRFSKISKISTSWATSHDMPDRFTGYLVYDIHWKDKVKAEDLKEFLDAVNNELETCTVTNIYDVYKEQTIGLNQEITYFFSIDNFSKSKLSDKLFNYDNMFKVAAKGPGGAPEITKVYFEDIMKYVHIHQHHNKLLITANLPIKMNPHLFISSITGKSMKWTLQNTSVQLVEHSLKTNVTCKCGKPANYSFLHNKQQKACPSCRGKLLLHAITKQT